jgi:myo-inositol 2-dehydrogenase / D-chiro-inositol 1-dehydrogenase
VNYFRDPPFKADDPAAGLSDAVDTLSWKPNFTAAANEDFKGYNALFGAFFAQLDGQATDLPSITDGVLAMRVLEAVTAAASKPGLTVNVVSD